MYSLRIMFVLTSLHQVLENTQFRICQEQSVVICGVTQSRNMPSNQSISEMDRIAIIACTTLAGQLP
jgi:hypothetical protein